MKISMRSCGLVVVSLLALCGCGNEGGSASLTGKLERPNLGVTRSAVGAEATGGFELVLSLGEYAAGPTEVSLGAFAIARDGTELYAPLAVDSAATFPVRVGVGETRRVPFTFDVSPDPAEADVLCAGPLAFRGSVSDTLGKNRPTTLVSGEITPTCSGP
jgi:hypothetical protein